MTEERGRDARAEASPADAPSRVQLWPEHFDVSVELGEDDPGRRAGDGGSPGDGDHSEPYLYVTPWSDVDGDRFWNEIHFRGASLPYSQLAAAADPRAAALEFLRQARKRLHT